MMPIPVKVMCLWTNYQRINSKIKENIYKLFDKLWHKQILETSKGNIGNSKLRSYKKFKVNLNLEK